MKEIQSGVFGISPMFFCGSCVSDESNKGAMEEIQCNVFEISRV